MDISLVSQLAAPSGVPAQSTVPAPAGPEQRALVKAVKAVNSAGFFGDDQELSFLLDRATHKVVVRLINRETHEVVRQIPNEYVLRLAEETCGE